MSAAPNAVAPAVNGWNAEYLEAEYRRFQADPEGVTPDLAAFFRGFDLGLQRTGGGPPAAPAAAADLAETLRLQYAASNLIDSYRRRGHLCAGLGWSG